MNLIQDLLYPCEMFVHDGIEKPYGISILKKALDRKLVDCEDYEVFVPLVYYRCLQFLKNKEVVSTLTPDGYFISNLGKVVRVENDQVKEITIIMSPEGYPRFWVTYGEGIETMIPLHRALACNFVIPSKELFWIHPKYLQVNHINGDKTDFSLGNLEWCTARENVKHAHANSLAVNPEGTRHYRSRPVKGTVLEGPFVGTEFILIGTKEIHRYGFKQNKVNRCCQGSGNGHYSCSFSYATEDEVKKLPRGLSDDIRESLLVLLTSSKKHMRYKNHVR